MNKLKTIGTTLLIILLTTTLLLYQGALIVRASTIRVPEEYATIQSAIDHASPGDIITVKAGVYSGFKVTKSLTIMGESNQTVVVKDSVELDANKVKVGSLKIILEESTGSSTALKIMGNNTNLVGVIIESYKDAVQLGTVDHEISGTLIEYSGIKSRADWYIWRLQGSSHILQRGRIRWTSNSTLQLPRLGIQQDYWRHCCL